MKIDRPGFAPSIQGPADYFTGTVRIDSPFSGSGIEWMEHVTDAQYSRD